MSQCKIYFRFFVVIFAIVLGAQVLPGSRADAQSWDFSLGKLLAWVPGVQDYINPPQLCDEVPQALEGPTAEALFAQGEELLKKGKFSACEAARRFFEIQRQFPHSKLYRPAWVKMIEALRLAEDYIAAINEANVYMEQNVGTPQVEYVHYLILLSVHEQVLAPDKSQKWTSYALGIQDNQDDESPFIKNLAYSTFLERFPNSLRRARVESMLEMARNTMAAQYLQIGIYYFERNQYRAALGRFGFVAKNGLKTTSFEPALYYLVLSYRGFAQQVRAGDLDDGRLRELTGLSPGDELRRGDIATAAQSSADKIAMQMRENLPNSPWTLKLMKGERP